MGPVRLLNLIGQLPDGMQVVLATPEDVYDRSHCQLCSVCKGVFDVPGHKPEAYKAAQALLDWHNAVETGDPMWFRCQAVYGLAALWVDQRDERDAA